MLSVLFRVVSAGMVLRHARTRTLRNIDVAAREAIKGGKTGIHVDAMLEYQVSQKTLNQTTNTHRVQDLPECFQFDLQPVLLRNEFLQGELLLGDAIRVTCRRRARGHGRRVNVVHGEHTESGETDWLEVVLEAQAFLNVGVQAASSSSGAEPSSRSTASSNRVPFAPIEGSVALRHIERVSFLVSNNLYTRMSRIQMRLIARPHSSSISTARSYHNRLNSQDTCMAPTLLPPA